MPTKDERRKALEDQLAALDDDPDDAPFDVTWRIRGEDGQERGGSMPWAQGQKIFGQWFPDLFGDGKPEPDKGDKRGRRGSSPTNPDKGDAGGGDGDGTPPGTVRFGRRVS